MTATGKLTAKNVAHFWTRVWANGDTAWRAGEVGAPFTRNLYAVLVGAGVESGSVPFTLTNTERQAPAFLNGPAECSAVRQFLSGRTVLVPLCGDSAVLPYLLHSAHVGHVIGVDLCAEALRRQREVNFAGVSFTTNSISNNEAVRVYEAELEKDHNSGSGGRVTLFEGDVTRLPEYAEYKALSVDFVYDRAALMAMAPTLRGEYISAITTVMAPHAVVAVEKMVRTVPAERLDGPPFMVDMEEALRLYQSASGRAYKSVCALVDDHPGPRHAEWYVVMPANQSATGK